MSQVTDNSRAAAGAAALRRYLGSEAAEALLSGRARPHDLYAACAQLVGARYAISTYLPRRLSDRQLASSAAGPWLEWVEGSLLFTDVSGSTALAERLTALGGEGTEIVTDTLNDYFGTMIRIIERAGGDLLTFGGDALLVLFTGPDHPLVASATALSLLNELKGFTRSVVGIGSFPLSMHIGVESGRLALVSAGQPHALRYSAMGSTVNAVARAEGYGGRGELVLGPQAWAAVAGLAEGEQVADGFVRLCALRHTAPVAPPPPETAPPALDRDSLAAIAAQLGQIAPYLPDTVLERILADPMQPRVEADLRPVSVLFAQVAGLSELVEALPAEAAARAVDAFLRAMQVAIQPFGGFVNKLDLADEGDKLLVVFGAPVAYEDHAERAARAALAMVDALPTITLGAAPAGSPPVARHASRAPLRLRIGINTGNVFAGNVGTAERKEYTVMGDAVNVAARVMAAAAWGEVRITRAAADLGGARLVLGDPRQVLAKGKAEPLELLRLLGLGGDAEAVAEAPLIGRDAELAWLRDQLAAAQSGHGRAARVLGEAGIGKSRLGAALLDQARGAGMRTLMVRCLSFNIGTPYAPWGDLVRELCAINPDDDPDLRAAKLAAALEAAGIPADDWLPLVAELARARAADNIIVRALDPQQRQARRFEIVLALLRAAALLAPPLLVVFDNLHWADQASLDLWQYLAGQIADDPILLLGLHRGEIKWGSGPQGDGAASLALDELDDAASAALLSALAPDLDDDLREAISGRAAGNPLFLEELLRAIHSGQAAVDALPDSLNGLLLARIDRLDERSRSLLRVASVIGQRFPIGLLQSLHPDDTGAIVRQLARLDSQDMTSTEREMPERVHLFRHALMQEVAYQSLLYARRRELHRKVGEYLERRYPSELERVRAEYGGKREALVQIGRNGSLLSRAARGSSATIFLLAHHYRLSDDPERATPYLLLAGHTARDDYANDQAILYYRWALELLPADDPRSWEARESLGDVLCTLGRYDEAQQEYAALVGGEPELGLLPPGVAAEVLRSWGDALEKQGSYHEALARLRQAEALVSAHLNAVPPLLLAAIFADMSTVLRRLGEYDQALAICESGLARVRNDRRSSEDERIEADLQQQIGNIYGMRGLYDKAQFHFENALAALEAIDDLFGCARLVNNLGYLAQLQGRYEEAVSRYERAEELAEKVSARYIIAGVRLNAAYCLVRLDRYAEAEAACADLATICAEIGDRDGLAKSDDLRGNIAYNRGDYPQAIRYYGEALAIYRELDATYDEGNSLAMLALAHCAMGDIATARELGEQAQQIAERIQVPQLIVEALIALAEADLVQLRGADASDMLLERAGERAGRAAALAEQIGSKLDYGVARRLAGEVAALSGAAFATHFAEAEAAFVATGSAFEQARTWAAHGAALSARNDSAAAAYLKRAEEAFKKIEAAGELRRLVTRSERSA
jgi:class 3 adenylate cyclase/tetratricopeptide (TPR) repeat protein